MSEKNLHHLKKIYAYINRFTGFDPSHYRASTLKRRLDHRLFVTNSHNYKNYLTFLKNNPQECFEFLDSLTINVTEFFRDKKVFSFLKKSVLPSLLENLLKKKRKYVRLWSIGCSSGEEPYSITVVLDELIKRKKYPLRLIIHATDVNKKVLQEAGAGIYKKENINTIPSIYRSKYFVNLDGYHYQVKKSIRRLIRFKHHDVIKENSMGKFDLIFCRNLFIFFEPHLQQKMFKKIHCSLKKEGILVLGTAESPKKKNLFDPLSSSHHIYRKKSPTPSPY